MLVKGATVNILGTVLNMEFRKSEIWSQRNYKLTAKTTNAKFHGSLQRQRAILYSPIILNIH